MTFVGGNACLNKCSKAEGAVNTTKQRVLNIILLSIIYSAVLKDVLRDKQTGGHKSPLETPAPRKVIPNPPTGHHQQTPSSLRDPPAETKVAFSSALFTVSVYWLKAIWSLPIFKYLYLLQGLDFMSSSIILRPIRAQF